MRIAKVLSIMLPFLSAVLPCQAQMNFLKFPDGVNAPYRAEKPLEAGDDKAEYAVIYVHGLNSKRLGDSSPTVKALLKKHPAAKKTIVVTPMFYASTNCPDELRGRIALWDTKAHDWRRGAASLGENGVSSFAVIDRIYELFSDRARYPKLRRIFLCGFSAGGQVVNRYIAVGKFVRAEHLEYAFAVGGPSTYLYIDGRRPMPDGTFRVPEPPVPGFDVWHDGLKDRNAYSADLSDAAIMANLASRPTLFMCGTEDVKRAGLVVTPGAMTQGENRYRRFLNYQRYIALFPEWAKRCRFVGVPGFGHQWSRVFAAPEFLRFAYGERDK